MNITGIETLVFGVEDMAGCSQYLLDYGLERAADNPSRYVALDGTGVELFPADAAQLPSAPNSCQMRKCVMGVSDEASLQAIATELERDREVKRLPDGSLESVDDVGFAIGFQVARRLPMALLGELSNAPGSPVQRAANQPGVQAGRGRIQPRSLSHVVYFVPDLEKAEAFYVQRLGFRVTDRFVDAGPFLQPAGALDHHSHFLIGAPAFMQGVEHFTFHFAGPTELIQNGHRFTEAGYQAFWGPGRHIFGSNWFWYFNSPFGCHVEMDADMDLHDNTWKPRVASLGTDTSQAFLLKYRNKWAPGPSTPENGDYA
ncbi:MAG: VOC family protein [Hydrogenophaga sp.]|uniref:VOC family protein n=1 Tax=Hydrogenophaga sp. TaxID=1904254 RepID=UPI0027158C9C|nr:VOC family protein [Hydrogenophaga sp.]MDO9603107.1 VOC family protein [Hydrogenophaga sp.]MDP3925765.1 VOC family protein [Hydrogenophaga sp.]